MKAMSNGRISNVQVFKIKQNLNVSMHTSRELVCFKRGFCSSAKQRYTKKWTILKFRQTGRHNQNTQELMGVTCESAQFMN